MVALGYIPRPSMSIGMCTESLGLGLHRDDSNRTLSQLFVCFVFFASCALFSLIVNLSNCSYTNPIHSFGAQGCDSCRTLAANPQTFFEFSSLPFFVFFVGANHIELCPDGSPTYRSFPTSLTHRRKRKPKQQRCSLSSSSTTHSMTYLTSTSIWSPLVSMATKTFHSPATTLTSFSHLTRYQMTVAISRPPSPLLPSVLVNPRSPGVKTSGGCRKTPRHLPNRAASLFMTLSSLLPCQI